MLSASDFPGCQLDPTNHFCLVCGNVNPCPENENVKMQCRSGRKAPRGPGDFLHDAILKRTGHVPLAGCQCAAHIAEMNRWGLAECRRRIDEIAGWLEVEAKKRGWLMRLIVSVPFVSHEAVKAFVAAALDDYEKSTEKEAQNDNTHRSS